MTDHREKDTVQLKTTVNVNFLSGLSVGVITGVGFHPVDRALYLRLTDTPKERQRLFSAKYWKHGMTGLRNTFYQRILSHGVYFSLQGELNARWLPVLKDENQLGEKTAKCCIGLVTGATTGFIANSSYAVKFYTFRKNRGGPLENAIEMYKRGGIRPFFKGIHAGIGRDSVFGVTYECMSAFCDEYAIKNVSKENTVLYNSLYFLSRFFSATIATTLSSPFNYVRNMQFNTSPKNKQPHAFDLLTKAWLESKVAIKEAPLSSEDNLQATKKSSYFPRLHFFQAKFMIGSGTLRAAAGISVGQMLFNQIKTNFMVMDESDKVCLPKNTV